MDIDFKTIVILILSALFLGGGGYAVIAKKKLKKAIALVAALLVALQEYDKSIADGTVTEEERKNIIAKVMLFIASVKALFTSVQVAKAIKKLE